MVRVVLLHLLLLISTCILSQTKEKHVTKGIRMGFVPEFQIGNQALSLGVTINKFKHSNTEYSAIGATVSAGFLTQQNVYTTSFTVFAHRVGKFPQANLGFKNLYHWRPNGTSVMSIRPEIGTGIRALDFKYGYDFFLNENTLGLVRHHLTIALYILPYKIK